MLVASFILFLFLVTGIIVKKFLLLANIKDHSGLEYDIPLTQALPELHMSIALIIGFILLLVLRVKNILFKDESIHLEELRLGKK